MEINFEIISKYSRISESIRVVGNNRGGRATSYNSRLVWTQAVRPVTTIVDLPKLLLCHKCVLKLYPFLFRVCRAIRPCKYPRVWPNFSLWCTISTKGSTKSYLVLPPAGLSIAALSLPAFRWVCIHASAWWKLISTLACFRPFLGQFDDLRLASCSVTETALHD